ncbi:Protein of unknown function [Onishia taeanensis]|uniref:DUF3034 family protein n=1 Tax=Onishia taeanensis TaxID=284577 RepID=A0A1G7UKM6_9GAMM|nr:DUF3034 family protein [Halomonas taeanensis]SDG48084.1 Protein of unknown function [Halomonas taeanensis]
MKRPGLSFAPVMLALIVLLSAPAAQAGSRLLATGGVTQIEGAAGGGLSPWGVLTGTASGDEYAATASVSQARVDDYSLGVIGIAGNIQDRLELSLARQRLDLDTLGGRLEQDVFGAKLRLYGDPLYDIWGTWSLGVQHKRMVDGELAKALGAKDTAGTDLYLATSKLWFAAVGGRNLLTNLTLRSTRANQGGLLGFGGDQKTSRSLVVEGSLGLMLAPDWVVGVEYRQKPDNLGVAAENDWRDLYVAHFFNKHVSLTGAWLDLGDIAGLADQQGGYLSLQVAL